MSSYKELYDSVKWQNDIMQNQYTVMRDTYSTDTRKVQFMSSDIEFYTRVNYILWIVYYIVFLFVIYVIFFGKMAAEGYSTQFQFMVLLLFAIFPMIITSVELIVYFLVARIYTLIFSIPYSKVPGKDNTPVFSLLDILPPGYNR
jgi:hypothetical protein